LTVFDLQWISLFRLYPAVEKLAYTSMLMPPLDNYDEKKDTFWNHSIQYIKYESGTLMIQFILL